MGFVPEDIVEIMQHNKGLQNANNSEPDVRLTISFDFNTKFVDFLPSKHLQLFFVSLLSTETHLCFCLSLLLITVCYLEDWLLTVCVEVISGSKWQLCHVLVKSAATTKKSSANVQ